MTPEEARARAAQFAEKHAPANDGPDEGEVLARVERADGTELRVSLHRFRGKDFLRIAPWQKGGNGVAWPVKGKGATVRPSELAAVVSGLAAAMDRIDTLTSAQGRRRHRERAAAAQESAPAAPAGAEGVDAKEDDSDAF